MAFIERNARWRDRILCAENSRILSAMRVFFKSQRRPRGPHIKDVPDHILRDIGLSEADVEPHRHVFPSQHTHHPRG